MGIETLAIASIASSVIGTGMSVMGQIQGANAQAQQAQYQSQVQANQANYMAQVARNNQIIQERNAKLTEQQGAAAEQQQRLRTAGLIGAQRTALAAQGGDINSGSALDIVGDTASAGETDALTIRSNAALKAYGFRLEGTNAGANAQLYDAAERNARTSGALASANATAGLPFAIGSSLLGGASSVADKWSRYKFLNDPTYRVGAGTGETY